MAVSVLEALVPDIGQLLNRKVNQVPELDTASARQRLLSTIINLFRVQNQWILLILEDLHWATTEHEILQQLTRLAPELPLLIVGSYRKGENSNLTDQFPLMQEILLKRFTASEIAEFSTSMLGQMGNKPEILSLLQRETEGNAFFMVEVVQTLAEEAGRLSNIGKAPFPDKIFPKGIQTIIERRLARVPSDALPLLVGTAIAGRQLDSELLPVLAEYTNTKIPIDTWLTICAEATILELSNGNWNFIHEKLRTGILETVDSESQQNWHQIIAYGIEQIYPNQPEQSIPLAYHWQKSGDLAKTRHYARLAGEYSQKQFLNETALEYYDQALNLTPESETNESFELHLAREQIFHFLGYRDAQRETLNLLGQLVENLDRKYGEDRRAELALRLARYSVITSDYRAAYVAAQQALQISVANSDNFSEAASNLAIGKALSKQGEFEKARNSYIVCLISARRHKFITLEADSLRALGVLSFDTGHMDMALKYYKQSLPLYDNLNHKRGKSTVFNNMSVVAISQGSIEQSLAFLEEAQKIDEEIGDQEGRARIFTNSSSLYLDLGVFDLSEIHAYEGLKLCREINIPFGEVLNLINLSLTYHYLNDVQKAEIYSLEAVAVANKINSKFLRGLALKDRAFLLLEQEKFTEAQKAYQLAIVELDQTDQVLEAHAGLAWLALNLGDETVVSAHLAPITNHLKSGQTLDGTSRPFLILLLTYKVLSIINDPYAYTVLEMAYNRLMHWANQITNNAWRESFLKRVPANLEILTLFEDNY